MILLILFVPPFSTADTAEPEQITPLADTYVDAWNITSTYGDRDYLEVAEYADGFSITVLMFDLSDISHVPSASSEITLRLYCFAVPSRHVVGVHWCVNNTWNEANLTFVSFSGFSRTAAEDAVLVDSIDVWYEWEVTNLATEAMEENYDKMTLALEVEDPLEGSALSWFASKDQTAQDRLEFSPQLVFAYLEPETGSNDTIVILVVGLMITATTAFVTYRFLTRGARKTRHRKARTRSRTNSARDNWRLLRKQNIRRNIRV